MMKRPKKQRTIITFSRLVALALFVTLPFAGYYLGINQEENRNTFQKILADKCKLIRTGNVYEQISQNDLPFNTDTKVVKINYKSEIENPVSYPIVCSRRGSNDTTGRSLIINNTMGQKITVYDHRSSHNVFSPEQQGQDEVPFVYDFNTGGSGNIKMGAFLNLSGSGNYFVGEQSVIVAGQKWLELPNGGVYYINVQREAIAKDDPRLVAILKKYSFNSVRFPGKLEINNWGEAQVKIRYAFFNDNMKSSEKNSVLLVKNSLNAFTAK
jgi:hypothetical protein